MITFNDKQVIVTGVNPGGRNARVHPVERLGDFMWVKVEDLRATTIQELEDELTAAPVIRSMKQKEQYPQRGKGAYRPSAAEIERSELQDDRIAMFRSEY